MKIEHFTEIESWQLARVQAKKIFKMINEDPFSKDWGLRDQINRSSGSVMDNIAEGFERSGNNEFAHFLLVAKGSNGEVQSQLYRAFDREYLNEAELSDLLNTSQTIQKKIVSFIKYLKQSGYKGFRYS